MLIDTTGLCDLVLEPSHVGGRKIYWVLEMFGGTLTNHVDALEIKTFNRDPTHKVSSVISQHIHYIDDTFHFGVL